MDLFETTHFRCNCKSVCSFPYFYLQFDKLTIAMVTLPWIFFHKFAMCIHTLDQDISRAAAWLRWRIIVSAVSRYWQDNKHCWGTGGWIWDVATSSESWILVIVTTMVVTNKRRFVGPKVMYDSVINIM